MVGKTEIDINNNSDIKCLSYEDFLAKSIPADQLPSVSIEKTDPACLFFSSGTTGKPKGVLISHESMYMCMQLFYENE